MHRKIVGICHLFVGTLTLFAVAALGLLFGGVWKFAVHVAGSPQGSTFLGIGLATIFFVFMASAIFAGCLSLVGGTGVLLGRKWGDVLATAISAVHLLNFPFGTALAAYTVYGLWFAEPAPLRAFPVREAQTSP